MTQPKKTQSAPKIQVGQTVRFEALSEAPISVTATGNGRVVPMRECLSVSQVDGRVTEILPGLAEGTLVDSGTLLIQIDPTDFERRISKTRANTAAAQANLAQIDRQDEDTEKLLEVEQRSFDVAQAEFDRIETLFAPGSNTGTALDGAKKVLLGAENSMDNLTNTRALYPSQRASAQATIV